MIRLLFTGTTMGLGNIISQTLIEHRGLMDLDWTRIVRFAAFGYVFSVRKFFSSTNLVNSSK
jgi:hypothetical protein